MMQLHLFPWQLSLFSGSGHGRFSQRNGLAHPRRPLAGNRLADPGARESTSVRRRQAANAGPSLHGCHLLRPAHGLSVESLGRHQVLPGIHGPRPLPGMGAGRRLLSDVEGRSSRIRLPEGHRLGVAEHGRVHDQGAPRGGKRPGKTPPTAPSKAPSAACWSKATASRWAWPWTEPTVPT